MAVGDKLVTLDGLKAVYQDVNGNVNDLKSAISEGTRNIWTFGNQDFIKKVTIYNANIPSGSYTISAEVLRESTADVNVNSRIIFYKNSVTSNNTLANPYLKVNSGRQSATFSLSEKADIIEIYASVNGSLSTNVDALWTDIQIEAGSTATDYIPPITAEDFKTRENVSKNTSDISTLTSGSVRHDISQSLGDSAKAQARTNIGAAASIPEPYATIATLVGSYTGETTITKTLTFAGGQAHPLVVMIDAVYTQSGTTAYPYLYFGITTDRNLKRTTMRYPVGKIGKYDAKFYRSIPYIWDNRNETLNIVVPSGCTLTIRNANCYYDHSGEHTTGGIQFHAHDGDCNIVPPQTLAAFKMAHAAGYNSSIVIPKVTSDGVWFAYHDDTFNVTGNNKTYLKDENGETITDTTYDGDYFHQIPWSYLSPLRDTRYGTNFSELGLMKLSDYLEYCAKVGMTPVFSMHPRPGIQTSESLNALKALVNQYGLLDKLIIKVPLANDDNVYNLTNLTDVYNVFGNDIAAYEVDAVSGMASPGDTLTLLSAVSGITVKRVVEYWTSQLLGTGGSTLAANVLSAGYGLSCVCDSYTDTDSESKTKFTGDAIKRLIAMGVTEFTDVYNTSNGLYW